MPERLILADMKADDLLALNEALTPKMTKYVPPDHDPTINHKLHAFLLLNDLEVFYGGAAGGAKTEGLLMAALQYVDVPGYDAILFRRTFQELDMANSLMNRAMEWLHPYRKSKEVHWSEKTHRYTFPSGATLTFGHIEHENDKYNYKSAEFQFIGFDELTGFSETQYRYLFSRLRRNLKKPWVPLRMRSGSNPGGEGHFWVKKRFLEEAKLHNAIFIPSLMEDNPALDRNEYEQSLDKLDAVEYEQLRWGNWEVSDKGPYFDRVNFKEITEKDLPEGYMKKIRYWDRAATKFKPGTPESRQPKFTAGVLMGEKEGKYYILDVQRFREDPAGNEANIKQTAINDGGNVDIWKEQEPGSAGVDVIDHYARRVLKAFHFQGDKVTGSKESRAEKFSTAVKQGRVYIIKAPWNNAYYDELELFPNGRYLDQADASSGVYDKLMTYFNFTHVPIGIGQGTGWATA
jgi:predicted phage terminase large subunit-like protein